MTSACDVAIPVFRDAAILFAKDFVRQYTDCRKQEGPDDQLKRTFDYLARQGEVDPFRTLKKY